MFYPAKEIIPNLWIGSEGDSRDAAFVRDHRIRFIVNGSRTIPFSFARVPSYRVPVDDAPWENETMGRPVATDAQTDAPRLYHLDQEIGEKTNVAARHPEVVQELRALGDKVMAEIGGKDPAARRPAGKVAKPSFLYPAESRAKAAGAKQPNRRKKTE